ncbi:hypothetical protein POSPLADRAFT_1184327 [Postia placenta MAD-698-R-SB12]|uniref:Calcineurin-like phosphoesterase domain-containing protein n=1 Tax=Postia placenta MAD-698-R-SB12 TaxID=670580 RepID=A0A1X6MT71_9APHY|nr:hypothetical protein POSPLADRAFT_1184327 [Postia placenta MAD-698-R-SB12]OSX59565.1 hypothetical protein POSPLADRAFT_1184327 [Postia placenta MAD-698-R-SB12]
MADQTTLQHGAAEPAPTLSSPTTIVHLQYDSNAPPPVSSPAWTRFVCISDTHSRMLPVPPGDVLLHSGDLTATGTYADFQRTMAWLVDLPHRTKIIIAGNHDLPLDHHDSWYDNNYSRWHGRQKQVRDPAARGSSSHRSHEQSIGLIQDLVQGHKATKAGIVYLEDQTHSFQARENGRMWTVYGSPWSPYFHNWAFNYERGDEAEKLLAAFPKTDILLTHGPPFQIFDRTLTHEHVGCEALAARLPALRPRLHVFGHIHEAHGALIREWPARDDASDAERTAFVNAANWPMGPRARRQGGGYVQFGEAPFQPVIVDLLDDA